MTARSLLGATLAAGLLCAAAPAAAPAATLYGLGKDIAYAVHVEGQGKYTYSERNDGGGGDWNGHDAALTFSWHGDIGDGVVFRNASPLDTTGDDLPSGIAEGSYTNTSNVGADAPCTPDPSWNPLHGWMRIVDDSDLSNVMPLDGSMDLWIRPFEQLDMMFDCGGDVSHPSLGLVGSPSEDNAVDEQGRLKIGKNPFDIRFNLPRDIIGMGYIEQLVPQHNADDAACPGWIADQTTACHLEWTAKIELRKISETAIPATGTQQQPPQQQKPTPPANDDDLLVPLVPPAPDDDLLVPLVPRSKASLKADASQATFSVSCRAGCSGTAALTAAPGARPRSASAASARPLARAAFRIAPGATKKITLRLSPKARGAVRRAGGARIAVRITAKGRTTSRTLTLRLPKRTKR